MVGVARVLESIALCEDEKEKSSFQFSVLLSRICFRGAALVQWLPLSGRTRLTGHIVSMSLRGTSDART